jgi:signal transduction histidine kinase
MSTIRYVQRKPQECWESKTIFYRNLFFNAKRSNELFLFPGPIDPGVFGKEVLTMIREDVSPRSSPIIFLTVVLITTCLVLILLGWNVWNSYEDNKISKKQNPKIEGLRGSIIHLDEVLTMSAFMAAATGDPQWEKRYRKFEPKLDGVIKEAMKLAPGAYSSEAAAETNAANIKLVTMENRAFDLVRQGRLDEAKEILFSEQYEKQKRIYAKEMEKFAASLSEFITASLKKDQQDTLMHISAVMILIPFLFISLFFVFRVARKWQMSLTMSNHRQSEQTKELADLNKSLDEKVLERTKELDDAYNKLKIEIKERKEVEEEQEKLQAQLRRTYKMEAIGILAGGIAHDFNNTLFHIVGYTELAMDNVPENSIAQKNLEKVMNATLRAKALVLQILDFSRQREVERKPLQIQPLIKEALKLLRSSLPTTIEIIQNIDKDCGPILADPT